VYLTLSYKERLNCSHVVTNNRP